MLLRIISVERLTYLLLFLFPILGMLVRGWLTSIYNFLFLLGLYYLAKRKTELSKEERYFLIICAVYVGVFVLSSLVNGWGKMQTRYLGTEIRFLLVIPIYLLVREYAESWKWLLLGGLCAAAVVLLQSMYEIRLEHASVAEGAYSKIIFGPFSALMAVWVVFLWRNNASLVYKIIIITGFCLAIIAAMLSGSRGSYFGILVMLIAGLLIFIRTKAILGIGLFMAIVPMLAYYQSHIVHEGVNKAVVQFEEYFSNREVVLSNGGDSSVGIRLEMWRAAKYFVPEHPILGFGPGNYKYAAQKYVDEGKVHSKIAQHGHPHNAYLEALYSKGLLGLISLLLLLYYPMYFMLKTMRFSRTSAGLGVLHIAGISAFSMVDASPILMNNYTSILLLGMAVFFSRHLQQLRLNNYLATTGK